MANDRCEVCGALFALVGYRHLCRPKSDGDARKDSAPVTARKVLGRSGEVVHVSRPAAARSDQPHHEGAGTTYKYRNPEKRKTYMRDYMKRRRAKVSP